MSVHRTPRLLASFAILGLSAAFTHGAFALGDPVSRADVKAQARAANLAGELRAGELLAPIPMPSSTRSREQRKAETRQANRDGGLGNNGAATFRTYSTSQRDALSRSTKTRDEGIAETRQAIHDHQLTPAGEGVGVH